MICDGSVQVYERALRLDGPTLANLELLENSEGGAAGSLLSRLDSCDSAGAVTTPRGPRMFPSQIFESSAG